MKASRTIGVSLLLVLLSAVDFCHGQSIAEDRTYKTRKAIDYAVQGKFAEAKNELAKALKVDPFYLPALEDLNLVEDAISKKISREVWGQIFILDLSRNMKKSKIKIRPHLFSPLSREKRF